VPSKDWTIRLEDMIEAVERIERFTRGIDFETFAGSEMVVYAVLHAVQLIGEAARHIPDDVQTRYPDIDWAGMRGMRNILVHDYAAVRLEVVWGVVERRIPPLGPRLREILALEQIPRTDQSD
jgi:uncharacterized protein with HEPN domain